MAVCVYTWPNLFILLLHDPGYWVCFSTRALLFSWRSCSCSVSHLVILLCSCGARLCPPTPPPHTNLYCLSRWWCLCFITHFPALLFSSSSLSSSSSFFCFLAVWTSLPPPPPPLDSVSVFMGPGTIRKAQNLLKQYSQHGLDGKKGGSNLTPLEGNAPRSSLRCLLSLLADSVPVMLCFHVVSHSEQQAHKSPQSQQL